MKCFKIVDGDLAVGGDGSIALVEGADRIRQELSLWLLEPVGTDPVYPKFGSELWGYIGAPAFEDNIAFIRAEVVRVVENFIETQQNQMLADKQRYSNEQFLEMWKDDDVISSLNSVVVSAANDTVNVIISLTTVAGASVVVEQSL